MLEWLFDTSMGVPGPNGHWPLWLSVGFHAANKISALCLIAIPLIVARYWGYRRDGVTPAQFWKVMAFMPALAFSRLMRFVEIWGPPYHLTFIADALSAITLCYCTYHLIPVIKHVLMLPSRKAMHDSLDRENATNITLLVERTELIALNETLQAKLDNLGFMMEAAAWTDAKAKALAEVKAMLAGFTTRNASPKRSP